MGDGEPATPHSRTGAAAAGLADRIGTITPGKTADLVIINLESPNPAPAADPASAIVAAAAPHDVDVVMVRGRILKDAVLTRPDQDDISRRATASRNRILTAS